MCMHSLVPLFSEIDMNILGSSQDLNMLIINIVLFFFFNV